jgi:hypothetical protein
MELHCVLKSGVALLQYYGMDQGTVYHEQYKCQSASKHLARLLETLQRHPRDYCATVGEIAASVSCWVSDAGDVIPDHLAPRRLANFGPSKRR